jgi:hypothetical protein
MFFGDFWLKEISPTDLEISPLIWRSAPLIFGRLRVLENPRTSRHDL